MNLLDSRGNIVKKELKTLEEIRIYSDPYRIQILNESYNFV